MAALRRLRPGPLLAVAILLAATAAASFALLQPTQAPGAERAGLQSPALAAPAGNATRLRALGILDTDGDGLSDAAENYVYGTDPLKASSGGANLPDGWVAGFGYDPLEPAIGNHPAAAPPTKSLPAAYHGRWPARFVPTLLEVYSFGRPAGHNESRDGPWQNGLDPTQWDGNSDGIPDGYLLAFGLDPRAAGIGGKQLAGPQGLTVREAFEHGTDPTKVDTDGDGIPDREEIAGPSNPRYPAGPQSFAPTDPTRYDTGGSGVCDGYLRAHGLDPNDPQVAYGDPAHSGNSTRDRFLWSRARFDDAACATGKGLDPTKASTLDLEVPDGWFLRFRLDPLDKAVLDKVAQDSATQALPCLLPAVPPPAGAGALPDVKLTNLDLYRHGRPDGWDEAQSGPWLGGLSPRTADKDGDGIPDALEIRGYDISVSTQVGLQAERQPHRTDSDPTKASTSGTMGDGAKLCPALRTAGASFNAPLDPRRRDTDFDGLEDLKELQFGLDPTKADTPGDFLADGERYALLQARAERYGHDLNYEFQDPAGPPQPAGGPPRSAVEWLERTPGGQARTKETLRHLNGDDARQLVGPAGMLDGRTRNVLNPDLDNDTLLNGWEATPRLYSFSRFGAGEADGGRPATDPLNADTDGDGLRDGWEVQFGAFDGLTGRYSLTPVLWDSGSGACPAGQSTCGDGAKDPDHDAALWTSYPAGAAPVQRTAPFSNLDEQTYGTDPNAFSSDGDGLGDGWKFFWGSTYPDKQPTDAGSDLGAAYPRGADGSNVAALAPVKPILGVDQSAADPTATYTYTRFVATGAARAGETVLRTHTVSAGSASRSVDEVRGTLPLTLQVAQQLGLNPYMTGSASSSDGDGMPDGFEILHGRLRAAGFPGQGDAGCAAGAEGLDPTKPDGATVGAGGLTFLQKSAFGGDPLCADNDLGGVDDARELGLLQSPMDPTDDGLHLGSQDTDHDGIPDYQEVTGTSGLHGGGAIRTDPSNPDTDGDGLLDGQSLPLDGTGYPAGNATARYFTDLGIAFTTRQVGGETRSVFLGEAETGTDPLNTFDAGAQVPTGWLKAQGVLGTGGDPARFVPHYTLGKPAWWNERREGPWWGGASAGTSPGQVESLRRAADLDCDGLKDRHDDGSLFEDPFPSANARNAWRAIAGTDLALARLAGVPATAPGGDPEQAGVPALGVRLRAQSFLDPGRADAAPFTPALSCPASDLPLPDITPDAAMAGLQLRKGVATTVSGRVTVAGAGAGKLTVEASLGDPPQVVGAGSTNPDGTFAFPATIGKVQFLTMPAGSLVLRGHTGAGPVAWETSPAAVPTGSNRLLLRTYATAATPPFSTEGVQALRSQAVFVTGVSVRAGSVLTLTAATTEALAGQPVTVSYQLTDSGGSPRQDPITLSGAGNVPPLTPDARGQGEAVVIFSSSHGSTPTLTATSQPNDSYVTPATAQLGFTLRQAATLRLEDVAGTDAGSTIHVAGRLTTSSGPVGAVPVAITVSGGRSSLGPFPATTAGDGRFALDVPLPPTLAYGTYSASASSPQTPLASAAGDSVTFGVRSRPIVAGLSTEPLEMGQPATVTGFLLEPDGQTPLAYMPVTLALESERIESRTAVDGSFQATFKDPLPRHPALQAVASPADAHHAASRSTAERPVRSSTHLAVTPGVLARGAAAAIPIKLTGADSRGIAGALLTAQWGSEPAQLIVTDASGTATFTRAGSAGDRLGGVALKAAFNGTADGLWGPSAGDAAWSVQALARIVLPDGPFDAGSPIPLGRLEDAGTGVPLGGRALDLRVGEALSRVTTDGQGRFLVVEDAEATAAPFRLALAADYAGGTDYPPAHATAAFSLRSPVTLTPQPPTALVAGLRMPIVVGVVDARGPVEGGFVNATLDGVPIGSVEVRHGVASLPVTVPAHRASGLASLAFLYSGTATSGAAQAEASVGILGSVKLDLQVQPAVAGGVATVRVLLTSNGTPLPNAPILLSVEGLSGLQATTDRDGAASFQLAQGNATLRLAARYGGSNVLAPASAVAELAPVVPESLLRTSLRIGAWLAGAAAATLAGLAYLLHRLRRHPLAPALRRAHRAIQGRGAYETQILRAYEMLEDAAIEHEILAGPANVPRDLEAAIAATLPKALHASLDRLITLFEQARYGQHVLGPPHRDAALAALADLRRHLVRSDPYWSPTRRAA
ncbi:MAG TPA: binary toxin-like calcium binding domain-containing protein [Candidatus Thermoplasmatota archaeon]|nr:binary toxin-like calcium binding domain-containing protein [Candidatus Thermoplasmatota archaeon]